MTRPSPLEEMSGSPCPISLNRSTLHWTLPLASRQFMVTPFVCSFLSFSLKCLLHHSTIRHPLDLQRLTGDLTAHPRWPMVRYISVLRDPISDSLSLLSQVANSFLLSLTSPCSFPCDPERRPTAPPC